MKRTKRTLTRRRLATLRGRLLIRREELLDELRGNLETSRTRRGAAPGDSGEEAATMLDQDTAYALAKVGVDEIEQIEEAIRRIDDGKYGHCLSCGEPIPVRRLTAMPFATQCVHCKERDEKRGWSHEDEAFSSWSRVHDLPEDMPDERAFWNELRWESRD